MFDKLDLWTDSNRNKESLKNIKNYLLENNHFLFSFKYGDRLMASITDWSDINLILWSHHTIQNWRVIDSSEQIYTDIINDIKNYYDNHASENIAQCLCRYLDSKSEDQEVYIPLWKKLSSEY